MFCQLLFLVYYFCSKCSHVHVYFHFNGNFFPSDQKCWTCRIRFALIQVISIYRCCNAITMLFYSDLTHLQNGEISRLLFSQLTFPTTAQFLMGMILIFNVRHLERQLGAKKFSAFVCLSYGVSVALQIAAVTMGSMMDAPIIPATGPYFFIFSCLPLYYCKYLAECTIF